MENKINLPYLELLAQRDDLTYSELKKELKGLVKFKSIGFETLAILNPKVKVVTAEGAILNESDANKGIIGLFNHLYNNERNRKYYRFTERYPNATHIFAEGDSWFCYPDPRNVVKDVIHYLHEDYLIYTSALGGDWASNMADNKNWNESLNKMGDEKSKCLLLSAGGNDMLGEIKQANSRKEIARSFNFIADYKTGMELKDLILPEFNVAINMVERAYRKMLTDIQSLYNNTLPVLCNTYDYPFPIVHEKDQKCGKYLGIVMKKKNINDSKLQRDIAVYFIDNHVEMLYRLKNDFPFLEIIDSRNLTKDASNWYNEIHLNSAFMNAVATNYSNKLKELGIIPIRTI